MLIVLAGCFLYSHGNNSDESSGQSSVKNMSLQFRVEEAPEWTALFNRRSGWIGGDGIFSIPLSGNDYDSREDSILFIFSDTMAGQIKEGELQPGWSMVNNSVAYLKGNLPDEDSLRFYYDTDGKGQPQTFFVPQTPAAREGDYYWLGDGFVNTRLNNVIYIFAYRMRNHSEKEWGFSEMGNVLVKIERGSKPPFVDHQQIETPFHFDAADPSDKGSFGAGILFNSKVSGTSAMDKFVYVYGVKGKNKQLLVARVQPEEFEIFNSWRFWDGAGWNENMDASASVADRVSNELSVSPLPDGRYALVYQENGIGNAICLRIGTTPYGPFGPQQVIWECSESQKENIVVYNAKAHPALSKPGELIISYNVNAFNFLQEIQKSPNLYHPRFIRMIFE